MAFETGFLLVMQLITSAGSLQKMGIKKILILLFLAFIAMANTLPSAFGQSDLRMRVEVSADANDNNPVTVDLVLVKDKALLDELKKLSASDWFENRSQYLHLTVRKRFFGQQPSASALGFGVAPEVRAYY